MDAYQKDMEQRQRERAADLENDYRQQQLEVLRQQQHESELNTLPTNDPRLRPLLADGARMHPDTEAIIKNALFSALETSPVGDVRPFSNPKTGSTGNVIILNDISGIAGGRCREFRISITHKKETRTMDTTACQKEGIGWKWGMN